MLLVCESLLVFRLFLMIRDQLYIHAGGPGRHTKLMAYNTYKLQIILYSNIRKLGVRVGEGVGT